MTKAAVQKNRNRRQRIAVVARHQIAADVELANVELLIARHAPMALARPVTGQDHKFQPVGLDRAFFERADDFVIAHRH